MKGSAFKFLTGWFIIILALMVVSRTRLGHTILYYFLWLAFTALLLANYRFFADVFKPTAAESGAQAGSQLTAVVGGAA